MTRAQELIQQNERGEISTDGARAALLTAAADAQRAATSGVSTGGRAIEVTSDERDRFRQGAVNSIIQRAGLGQLIADGARARGEQAPDLNPGEFRGIRNAELARMSLERCGQRVDSWDRDLVVGQAMALRMGPYQSTSDFPVILEEVVNRVLQAAYATTPDTWRQFAGVGSVSDFKATSQILLGAFGALDPLLENGEVKNKAIPDGAKATIQASTRANIIGLTRQAIVNDDLGAFNDLAVALGRAGKLSIEQDIYKLLALNGGLGPVMGDGKTLFHNDHANIVAGAGLSIDQIEKMDTPRVFEWRTDLYMPGAWVGQYTPAEIKNLGIDFTGELPAANVEGLTDAQDAIDSIAAIDIAGFRATALSGDANPKVELAWEVKGTPTAQTISWGSSTIAIAASARTFTPKDWAAVKPIFVVGNSLSTSTDTTNRWSQLLAADRKQPLYSVARYTSDWSQVYRSGAVPIYLTIAGGALPAGGTAAAVTLINGAAPTASPSANPASFLNTGDGGLTTGVSMAGTIVAGTTARHVTVSTPNAASTAYSIVQDAGAAALPLTGPVLFIPDIAKQIETSDLILWTGNNYYYSGVGNQYGDYTNPQMWVDMARIVAAAAGHRVLILPILPAADEPADGTPNPGVPGEKYHLQSARAAANARTEALFPTAIARDAAGRTLLKRLQDSGNGSANDNADVAAGLTPRSLRTDALHLNGAGDAVVFAFVKEALARQALPSPVTQNTVFTLIATGTNPRTGAEVRDTAYAVVRGGELAALLDPVRAAIDGVVGQSEYRETLAAAVADFEIGTFFVSRDRDGVSEYPGIKRQYQIIAQAPYWADRGPFVGKADLDLDQVDNTADREKPVSRPQAAALATRVTTIGLRDDMSTLDLADLRRIVITGGTVAGDRYAGDEYVYDPSVGRSEGVSRIVDAKGRGFSRVERDPRWKGPIQSGAPGLGYAVYLGDVFETELQFAARFPAAYDVWRYFLRRMDYAGAGTELPRTKPGGVNDPVQGDAAARVHWRNLTYDWCHIQELLETEDLIFIEKPPVKYVTSDTLLFRRDFARVIMQGELYQTRGGSRGNLLAIGEGVGMSWDGGVFDAADALGDNAVTIFQALVGSSVPGWEPQIAELITLRNFTGKNARRDATYGGGKAGSWQLGWEGAHVENFKSIGCEIGWSREGKLTSVPAGGPTPARPYYGRGLTMIGAHIKGASLMGCWLNAATPGTDSPSVGSDLYSGILFEDCAIDNPAQGVICCDRTVGVDMTAKVIMTQDTGRCIPLRGTPRHSRFRITTDLWDTYETVDTRHPTGHGSNLYGAVHSEIDVNLKIRNPASVATALVYEASGSGGQVPAPESCAFRFSVSGYRGTLISNTALNVSNRVEVRNRDVGADFAAYGTVSNTYPIVPGSFMRDLTALGMRALTEAPAEQATSRIYWASATWDPLGTGRGLSYPVQWTGTRWAGLAPLPAQVTAATLLSAASTVNTTNKVRGRQVEVTTTGATLKAMGSAPTDPWADMSGATVYTPA